MSSVQDTSIRESQSYLGDIVCSRCIYHSKTPGITFDDQGVCRYCRQIEQLAREFKTGTADGEAEFDRIVEQIKRDGRGKKFDCIVGVSGGTDSSYMIHLAVQRGLRPLAVHYDNTWNTAVATQNIYKVLKKLNVELYTYVVDNEEADDILKSFFLAGVPEVDGPTDLALAQVMYSAAHRHGVKYVLEGHSFLEEGVSPLGGSYIDGKYIQSIHRMFGKRRIKTFPNMPILTFLRWVLFSRIKKIRPFWYIKYSKKEAQAFLQKEYGWQYYGGHHLENRATAFNHSVYLPQKFQQDQRANTLAAAVRNGSMSREQAMKEYLQPPHVEENLVEYFKKRLSISDLDYQRIMSERPKSYQDYPTYKQTFERMRPLFEVLGRANLVPRSFVMKYCYPAKKI